MRRHKRPFCGELLTALGRTFKAPKLNPDRGVLIYLLRTYQQATIQRQNQKLDLLLAHYLIPRTGPDHWKRLALALASDYVPGFRVEKPAGAKRKWGPNELGNLLRLVDRLVQSGMRAMDVCRQLAAAPDRQVGFPKSRNARTIYRRYQEAKHLAR